MPDEGIGVNKIYPGLPHLNGHLLCAIDFETTGARPGYHEPIQVAVVPLNEQLRPNNDIRPFYTNIRPLHPGRAQPAATRVHKLDINDLVSTALHPERVEELFIEWVEALRLPAKKVIIPLAHNWAFEYGFLGAWFGIELRDNLFHAHARDAMIAALEMNDRSFFLGETTPFQGSVSLTSLCKHFGVINKRPHDALCDCIAEAEVYRHILQMDTF